MLIRIKAILTAALGVVVIVNFTGCQLARTLGFGGRHIPAAAQHRHHDHQHHQQYDTDNLEPIPETRFAKAPTDAALRPHRVEAPYVPPYEEQLFDLDSEDLIKPEQPKRSADDKANKFQKTNQSNQEAPRRFVPGTYSVKQVWNSVKKLVPVRTATSTRTLPKKENGK